MSTTAEIAGSRILVRPTMAETLVVAAIRGATWDRKVNAMLLKQVQTQQRTIEAQAAALPRLEERLAALEGDRRN